MLRVKPNLKESESFGRYRQERYGGDKLIPYPLPMDTGCLENRPEQNLFIE